MSSNLDRQSLIDIFVIESSEALNVLTKAFYPSDGTTSIPTPTQLQEQYVWAHKIRGASALYGYEGLALMGTLLESTLEQAPSIEASLWPKTLEVLRGIVTSLKLQLNVIAAGGVEDPTISMQWKREIAGLFQPMQAAVPTDESTSLAPDYLVPSLDAEVLSYFAPEAEEYLQTMESLLQHLRQDPKDGETIQALFRTAHTLKGSAHTIGFHVIGDVVHPIEDYMIAVRDGQMSLSPDALEVIGRAVDIVKLLMRRDHDAVNRLQHDIPDVTQTFAQIRNGEQAAGMTQAAAPATPVIQVATTVVDRPDESAGSAVGSDPSSSTLADEYLLPLIDAEVLSYFAPEAQEYLESLEAQLLRLEKEPHNSEVINQVFRTAHTLKGSAYTVGFQSIGDLTHYVEDFMGAVRDGRVKILPGHTDMLLRSVDVVRQLMRLDPTSLGILRQRYAAAMSGLRQMDQTTAALVVESNSPAHLPKTPVGQESRDQEEADHASAAKGKPADGRAADDREVIRVNRDRLERLLNLVGELVIGRGRLDQRLHMLEQLSQQVLAYKGRLVESVRSFEEKHTFTLPTATSDPAAVSTEGFTRVSDFGSLEFDKYDDFNILARRIGEVTADISESMTQLSGSIRRSQEDMSQLAQLTLGMRDEIARARMVPIGTPFTRFRRAVREMARATGKEVTLATSGEHTEVDTGVVERLVDPLIHLVRNAVYHGVELPAERLLKGKPMAGTIYLHAAHRGNAVLIEVEDDGAGLNIEKIRAKVVERGLLRQEVARSMSESEVIKFIFVPGFSTADQIGEQAGRGVGMDVVKRVIESMNGHIDVESVRGVGTKFTLSLPLTLLIATALMVRAGSERYAIPLPAVREVTMLTPNVLQRMGERSILHIGDETIEVQSLQQVLNRSSVPVEIGKPVVIMRTAAGMIGLLVDELLGRQEIVIKPLGSLRSLDRSSFGGATIDPEGRVILVLDPARLLAREVQADSMPELPSDVTVSANSLIPYAEASESKAPEQPLLLIDDSLSIRKFVGRMLESAGYEVDTAVDGEEGLRKAAARNYRLIITDLEMPKLNGFEVIQGLRSRVQTQQTPIIVMTTRAGDKHRQMALNIGASSYIAKPVEERALIQEIERWIGRETAARN
jgi:chemosensory pili system protein ChpA (sensor histidine kinase/response regulator)